MRETRTHEIRDARTGETWQHVSTVRAGRDYCITVKNQLTGQTVSLVGPSQKWTMYDALVKCGCPRGEATKAAKLQPW